MLLTVAFEDRDLFHFEVKAMLSAWRLCSSFNGCKSGPPLPCWQQASQLQIHKQEHKPLRQVDGDVGIDNLKAMLEATTEVAGFCCLKLQSCLSCSGIDARGLQHKMI